MENNYEMHDLNNGWSYHPLSPGSLESHQNQLLERFLDLFCSRVWCLFFIIIIFNRGECGGVNEQRARAGWQERPW